MSLALWAACSTAAPPAAELQEPSTGQKTRSEVVLFSAIVAELQAQGHVIETSSERFRTVSTTYEAISPRLRRRRVAGIVVLPQGGALKVEVQVERDEGPDGQPLWRRVTQGPLVEEATTQEQALARAIERRFHAMR